MVVLPTWPERQKPTQGVLQRENDSSLSHLERGNPRKEEKDAKGPEVSPALRK